MDSTGPVSVGRVSWNCNDAGLHNCEGVSTWDILGAAKSPTLEWKLLEGRPEPFYHGQSEQPWLLGSPYLTISSRVL